jgi:hypothetical protein
LLGWRVKLIGLDKFLVGLPADWTPLQKYLYIDKGFAKEIEYKIDQLLLEANKPYCDMEYLNSDRFIKAGFIRTYFAYCAYLNLVYYRLDPSIINKVKEHELTLGTKSMPLLAALASYELLLEPNIAFSDSKIIELSRVSKYYLRNVRTELWQLITAKESS